jgi:fibronectin-binding autotransporter adhesin
MEVLEARLAPATLNWTNPSGGNWDQASNWSGGVVPGSGDDAVINTSAAATITIQPGENFAVHSITTAANDTLAINGGSLTVNSSSTLSGGLTMTGGTLTASGSGVSVVVNGTTSVSGANLYAQGGATLSLPELTSYSAANSSTFQASGTGSLLALPALTSLAISGQCSILTSQGGHIDLSGLPSLSSSSGDFAITADGSNSRIDLSHATSLSTAGTSYLDVSNQGTILDGRLTTLTTVNLYLDGTGTLADSQWTSLTYSSLNVSGGSSSLGLTDIDGSSLSVSGGASLALPQLTSYSTANGNTFQASGTGSLLDLPAMTSVAISNYLNILANQGGHIDLSGLPSLTTSTSGGLTITADGSNSEIDLSHVTSLSTARRQRVGHRPGRRDQSVRTGVDQQLLVVRE